MKKYTIDVTNLVNHMYNKVIEEVGDNVTDKKWWDEWKNETGKDDIYDYLSSVMSFDETIIEETYLPEYFDGYFGYDPE